MDLSTIRSAAEGASGEHWHAQCDDKLNWHVGLFDAPFLVGLIATLGYGEQAQADATYIATMDPQTTLALIARAENAEQERDAAVELLRESQRQLAWMLDENAPVVENNRAFLAALSRLHPSM